MATLQEIWNVGLGEYNKIRKQHGLPNIKGDDTMHADAQRYAEFLSQMNKFEPTTMGKYANNISMSVHPNLFDGIKDSIRRLHEGQGNKHYLKADCTRMGLGVSRNDHENKWVHCFFFEIPGMTPRS